MLGFAAAAWKTQPRDLFIGWTVEQREARLHLNPSSGLSIKQILRVFA
jgi:hypothetical protein